VVNDRCFVFNNLRYNLATALVPPFRLSNDTDHGTGAVPFKAVDMAKASPEKAKEYRKRYEERHPEKKREIRRGSDRRYRETHAETVLEKARRQVREWRAANPIKVILYGQKRRALKHGNGGTVTVKEWLGLKEKYNNTCLRCGRSEPEIKMTPDHVKPLSKGGSNSIDNIQPLCFSCNSSKQAKHIDYRPNWEGRFN
jgi:5-methylcytosine-specific restriction endonuclease McrA